MSSDSINYLLLQFEDESALAADREFVPAVLEARLPHLRLNGTSEDLLVLQEVLRGGPYSEDPVGEIAALGTALGDIIARSAGMSWIRYSDDDGIDLALRYQDTSVVVFPRSMILKRIESDEVPDFTRLHDEVCRHVREMITSGEYR